MWVTKLLISPVKIRIFCPKTSKFGPKFAFLPGLAASFVALLVGWLVVVAGGLYLARHLFTLFVIKQYCVDQVLAKRNYQAHLANLFICHEKVLSRPGPSKKKLSGIFGSFGLFAIIRCVWLFEPT